MKNSFNIAIADDHTMFRRGMSNLINLFPDCKVVLETGNGRELITAIPKHPEINIVLMDIDMPEMNGFEATAWLKENYPDIKVLALSTMDAEASIIKMIKAGARGYFLKDAEPDELKDAFRNLMDLGFHYNANASRNFFRSVKDEVNGLEPLVDEIDLSPREKEFLKHACSELTYKEIAHRMSVSERTVDGYRESLFRKCNAVSRIGLVLFAFRTGVI